jgi:hypothetical protein
MFDLLHACFGNPPLIQGRFLGLLDEAMQHHVRAAPNLVQN